MGIAERSTDRRDQQDPEYDSETEPTACAICRQLSPRNQPAPSVNRNGDIFSVPDGTETTLRAPGTILAKKTTEPPYFTNQPSARSRSPSFARSHLCRSAGPAATPQAQSVEHVRPEERTRGRDEERREEAHLAPANQKAGQGQDQLRGDRREEDLDQQQGGESRIPESGEVIGDPLSEIAQLPSSSPNVTEIPRTTHLLSVLYDP